MGSEATCHCQWASEAASCKVLLETNEVIVRGSIRRSVPIASLTAISVRGDQLRFRAGEDEVALSLGAPLAEKWAKKLTSPPPTLAAKLGISGSIRVAIFGELSAQELDEAVATSASAKNARVDPAVSDLILAEVRTIDDLRQVLGRYAGYPGEPPIWIIYPKGKGKPLAEAEVRDTLRHEGFIDTKVASVSQTLTALRFIRRA
jgi:hypothetical protein